MDYKYTPHMDFHRRHYTTPTREGASSSSGYSVPESAPGAGAAVWARDGVRPAAGGSGSVSGARGARRVRVPSHRRPGIFGCRPMSDVGTTQVVLLAAFAFKILVLIMSLQIYLRSTRPSVVVPPVDALPPPLAKRVVLFMVDGLSLDVTLKGTFAVRGTRPNSEYFEELLRFTGRQAEEAGREGPEGIMEPPGSAQRGPGTVSLPFMRWVMTEEGMWGVAHVRAPTESVPGHMSVLGGYYEDPVALFHERKSLDTLFNRAGHTASVWTSSEQILTLGLDLPLSQPGALERHHVRDNMLEHENVTSCTEYDERVFEELHAFFRGDARTADSFVEGVDAGAFARSRRRALDPDSRAGFFHVQMFGPDCHEDIEEEQMNVQLIDRNLKWAYEEFERRFPDRSTAYVIASDHGTFGARHGWQDPQLTQVPYLVWGAGVRKMRDVRETWSHLRKVRSSNELLRRLEVNQRISQWGMNTAQWQSVVDREDVHLVDMCPLMATLLGVPVPVWSLGTLPIDVTTYGSKGRVEALMANARQLLNQYYALEDRARARRMFFRPYSPLREDNLQMALQHIATLLEREDKASHAAAEALVLELMNTAREGINYVYTYDWPLLFFVMWLGLALLTMLVWVSLYEMAFLPMSVALGKGLEAADPKLLSPRLHSPSSARSADGGDALDRHHRHRRLRGQHRGKPRSSSADVLAELAENYETLVNSKSGVPTAASALPASVSSSNEAVAAAMTATSAGASTSCSNATSSAPTTPLDDEAIVTASVNAIVASVALTMSTPPHNKGVQFAMSRSARRLTVRIVPSSGDDDDDDGPSLGNAGGEGNHDHEDDGDHDGDLSSQSSSDSHSHGCSHSDSNRNNNDDSGSEDVGQGGPGFSGKQKHKKNNTATRAVATAAAETDVAGLSKFRTHRRRSSRYGVGSLSFSVRALAVLIVAVNCVMVLYEAVQGYALTAMLFSMLVGAFLLLLLAKRMVVQEATRYFLTVAMPSLYTYSRQTYPYAGMVLLQCVFVVVCCFISFGQRQYTAALCGLLVLKYSQWRPQSAATLLLEKEPPRLVWLRRIGVVSVAVMGVYPLIPLDIYGHRDILLVAVGGLFCILAGYAVLLDVRFRMSSRRRSSAVSAMDSGATIGSPSFVTGSYGGISPMPHAMSGCGSASAGGGIKEMLALILPFPGQSVFSRYPLPLGLVWNIWVQMALTCVAICFCLIGTSGDAGDDMELDSSGSSAAAAATMAWFVVPRWASWMVVVASNLLIFSSRLPDLRLVSAFLGPLPYYIMTARSSEVLFFGLVFVSAMCDLLLQREVHRISLALTVQRERGGHAHSFPAIKARNANPLSAAAFTHLAYFAFLHVAFLCLNTMETFQNFSYRLPFRVDLLVDKDALGELYEPLVYVLISTYIAIPVGLVAVFHIHSMWSALRGGLFPWNWCSFMCVRRVSETLLLWSSCCWRCCCTCIPHFVRAKTDSLAAKMKMTKKKWKKSSKFRLSPLSLVKKNDGGASPSSTAQTAAGSSGGLPRGAQGSDDSSSGSGADDDDGLESSSKRRMNSLMMEETRPARRFDAQRARAIAEGKRAILSYGLLLMTLSNPMLLMTSYSFKTPYFPGGSSWMEIGSSILKVSYYAGGGILSGMTLLFGYFLGCWRVDKKWF